jgi:hypothetical protein
MTGAVQVRDAGLDPLVQFRGVNRQKRPADEFLGAVSPFSREARVDRDEGVVTGVGDGQAEIGVLEGVGPELELRLGQLAFADIPADAQHQVAAGPLGAAGAHLHVVFAAVLAPVAGLEDAVGLAEIGESFADLSFAVDGIEVPGMQGGQFLRRIAQHLGEALVGSSTLQGK